MLNNFTKTCLKETFGNCSAHSHDVSLSKGTAAVLHTTEGIKFGMSGCHTAPLTELLKLFDGIESGERQHGVKHCGHVSGIKEKAIACYPCGILRIVNKKIGIKKVSEIGSAHGTAGMARLCLLHHRGDENAHVVGSACHQF